MARYITVRLVQGLIVILLISVVTFIIMRLLPGDPVFLLLGEGGIRITDEQIRDIRARWGLDDPWHVQYLTWVKNMFTGNFGKSLIRPGVPVRDMILEVIPVTFKINVAALIIALMVALPGGILAAVKRNSVFDYGATIFSTLGVALPNFWIGLMLIVLFSLVLKWLPPFGLRSWQGYIMPIIVMSTLQMAVIMRVVRGSLIEELGEDYVRTARAKGLSERMVNFVHAGRNALIPIATMLGPQITGLLGGAVITETIWSWPGLGRMFIEANFKRDYPVVLAGFVIGAIAVILGNMVSDVLYAAFDPRIRLH